MDMNEMDMGDMGDMGEMGGEAATMFWGTCPRRCVSVACFVCFFPELPVIGPCQSVLESSPVQL